MKIKKVFVVYSLVAQGVELFNDQFRT